MSGYQVQTPNFFVNLNAAGSIDAQVTLLNSGVNKFAQALYATGPLLAEDMIGKLITYTGVVGATNISLPSTNELLEAVMLNNQTALGNQIVNVPPAQSEILTAPTIGTTWEILMKNDSASAVTLVNVDLDVQAGSVVIASGALALWKAVITGESSIVLLRL